MFDFIWKILKPFRGEFKNVLAFHWFVVIVTGFVLRSDLLGVTDVIRTLALRPECYEAMIHFFRAASWDLHCLRVCWCQTVRKHMPLFRVNGHLVLLGDETMQAKEGRRMPGIKKYRQHSQTQSKATYIWGHMFGCVGVLIGSVGKLVCLPLLMLLHDGLRSTVDWDESNVSADSHILQTAKEQCLAARCLGEECYALLDRYFLSLPFLREIKEWNQKFQEKVWVITRAKGNVVAYQQAPVKAPGQRGRPRKKGDKIKVSTLFEEKADQFVSASVEMYGREEEVKYLYVDLLWGRGLYQPMRFVLVRYHHTKCILVSTDLSLTATDIIRLYSYRVKIEGTFRTMKQQLGTLAYHFWTKSMDKINLFRKKTDPDPLHNVVSEADRTHVMLTVRAMEMYTLLSCIAMGILQSISVEFDREQIARELRYQRTPAQKRPSEANIMEYLRRSFFVRLDQNPLHELTQIIRKAQHGKNTQNPPNAA